MFKAWTEPDQVARWYGPAHADIPSDGIRIEPKVGGMFPDVGSIPRRGHRPAKDSHGSDWTARPAAAGVEAAGIMPRISAGPGPVTAEAFEFEHAV